MARLTFASLSADLATKNISLTGKTGAYITVVPSGFSCSHKTLAEVKEYTDEYLRLNYFAETTEKEYNSLTTDELTTLRIITTCLFNEVNTKGAFDIVVERTIGRKLTKEEFKDVTAIANLHTVKVGNKFKYDGASMDAELSTYYKQLPNVSKAVVSKVEVDDSYDLEYESRVAQIKRNEQLYDLVFLADIEFADDLGESPCDTEKRLALALLNDVEERREAALEAELKKNSIETAALIESWCGADFVYKPRPSKNHSEHYIQGFDCKNVGSRVNAKLQRRANKFLALLKAA